SALLLTKLAEPTEPAAVTLPAGFTDGLVASVASPTALAFTPDVRMLITTQTRRLLIYQNGTLRGTALDISSRVCSNSERGLLGIAVDPDFASNQYIYVYYTYKKHGVCEQNTSMSPVNRVSRFTMTGDTAGGEQVLVDNIPSPNGNHNAGDVHFGKDGYLYISVGDGGCDYAGNSGCAGENDASRDKHVLVGKVLRITRNGGIPETNPYAATGGVCAAAGRTTNGTQCKETFASGLRNPFRMAFDPDTTDATDATGTSFFINDVGQNAWEEIDRGASGVDYGWNVREGFCANGSTRNCRATPEAVVNGITDPIHAYSHSTGCSSVTGGAFVPDASNWPAQYDGSYLYGDYVCGRMFNLTPRSGGGFDRTTFLSGLGRGGPTTMTFGPYGGNQALYYTTYTGGGEVRRIAYADGNRVPTAIIEGEQLWDETLKVEFDGSSSSDPDDDTPLTYIWDFGDGTTPETITDSATSHTYARSGKRIATLQVRDSRGALSDPYTVEVFPGNTPPVPAVTAPGADYRFRVGSQVGLSGAATDPEDSTVQGTSLKWEVLRHHNASHAHPYDSGIGGRINVTAPPPEDLSSTGVGNNLEAKLTATDSEGLRKTVSRRLEPRRVNVTFRTAPVRLGLIVNGTRFRAPRTLLSWHGYGLRVEAPRRAKSVSGRRWAFKSWSDGRSRQHVILTPAFGATYTARYKRLPR
ncbi:MAG: PQQ-dependent sugar dehydrogenase, partial [Rubrobacteraceae bacterium]